MKWLIACFVFFVLIVLGIFVFYVSVRNGLINRDETVKQAWAQIDTQLQRRADLIPNLVNTVKGYAAHEKEVFENVSNARSRLLAAKTPAGKADASEALSGALGRLLAIVERYPDLKANTNFIRLQDELAGTENRIAVARKRYNDDVRSFNAAIRKFPGSLFAGGMGFVSAEYFQPKDRTAVEKPPEVKF